MTVVMMMLPTLTVFSHGPDTRNLRFLSGEGTIFSECDGNDALDGVFIMTCEHLLTKQ